MAQLLDFDDDTDSYAMPSVVMHAFTGTEESLLWNPAKYNASNGVRLTHKHGDDEDELRCFLLSSGVVDAGTAGMLPSMHFDLASTALAVEVTDCVHVAGASTLESSNSEHKQTTAGEGKRNANHTRVVDGSSTLRSEGGKSNELGTTSSTLDIRSLHTSLERRSSLDYTHGPSSLSNDRKESSLRGSSEFRRSSGKLSSCSTESGTAASGRNKENKASIFCRDAPSNINKTTHPSNEKHLSHHPLNVPSHKSAPEHGVAGVTRSSGKKSRTVTTPHAPPITTTHANTSLQPQTLLTTRGSSSSSGGAGAASATMTVPRTRDTTLAPSNNNTSIRMPGSTSSSLHRSRTAMEPEVSSPRGGLARGDVASPRGNGSRGDSSVCMVNPTSTRTSNNRLAQPCGRRSDSTKYRDRDSILSSDGDAHVVHRRVSFRLTSSPSVAPHHPRASEGRDAFVLSSNEQSTREDNDHVLLQRVSELESENMMLREALDARKTYVAVFTGVDEETRTRVEALCVDLDVIPVHVPRGGSVLYALHLVTHVIMDTLRTITPRALAAFLRGKTLMSIAFVRKCHEVGVMVRPSAEEAVCLENTPIPSYSIYFCGGRTPTEEVRAALDGILTIASCEADATITCASAYELVQKLKHLDLEETVRKAKCT